MICSIIWILVLFWIIFKLVIPLMIVFIKYYILIPRNDYSNIIAKSGQWAVVTGATDGIGLEYCRQFAKLGKSVFLISRNENKLREKAKEIKEIYGVEVNYLSVDFVSDDIYETIEKSLDGLDIGILVNNVGMTQEYPCKFSELNVQYSFLSNFIHCNILSVITMSKIVIPNMIRRNRGIILNISSASTISPMPMSALYSSTKIFIKQFSRSVSYELSDTGIIVQTVLPFYVQTKFIGKFRPPRIFTPTAEEYVESAIKTINVESVTFGTLSHWVQAVLTYSLPTSVRTFGANIMNKRRAKAVRE